MVAILQTTFSNAFSSMKMLKFRLRFHWSLFLRVHSRMIQIMAWHQPGDKPLSEQTMVSLLPLGLTELNLLLMRDNLLKTFAVIPSLHYSDVIRAPWYLKSPATSFTSTWKTLGFFGLLKAINELIQATWYFWHINIYTWIGFRRRSDLGWHR